MLLLELHPDDVNRFFWKLIDSSKQVSVADSSPEIPVVVGSESRAKAQARNVKCGFLQ